jgi:hypothetical protein
MNGNSDFWRALLMVAALFMVFRWTGWFRRGSGAEWLARDPREVNRLDARLAVLEQLEGRVAELENRLDFTERLLAQRSEVGRPE